MTKREEKEYDLNEAFFPVREEPIHYGGFGNLSKRIYGYKAIVNKESGNVLSVVSSKYRLLLNKEAYELADHIVRVVFDGKTLADFKCFNMLMPNTKGSCKIDLIIPNNFNELFGSKRESWTPFVRISNSYNRTMLLRYEIGFCRWICKNGMIFGQFGFTFSMNHSERITYNVIDKLTEKAYMNIGHINSLWSKFEEKMTQLKNTPIPMSSALAMFCKAFDIKIEKNEMSDNKIKTLQAKAKQIITASKEYFKELGNNGYAMMNVLSDFASNPEWTLCPSNFVDGYQRKVGLWVDNFLNESRKEGFSPSKYIGDEYHDTAYYLESLVPQE